MALRGTPTGILRARALGWLGVVLMLCVPMLVASAAHAQDIGDAARKIHQTYRADDGLPQATTFTLEVDRRGWVWAGTQDGVAFFDGRGWETVEPLNRAIEGSFWRGRRILEDRDGVLWFGTQDGVYSLEPRPPAPPALWPFTHYTYSDGLASDTILAILERPDGRLLFGTPRGVSVLDEEGLRPFPLPSPLVDAAVAALYTRSDGSLLLGGDSGVYRYAQDQWQRLALPEPLDGRPVHAILESSDGALWLAVDGGVLAKRPQGWEVLRAEDTGAGTEFVALAEVAGGEVWVGTASRGVHIYSGPGSWSVLDPGDGLASPSIHAIVGHPDGTAWIGTANGLSVYKPAAWDVIDGHNGLPVHNVWSIMQHTSGAYWFGTEQGIARYADGRWEYISEGPGGEPLGSVVALHEADDGTIWIGGSTGLARYREGRWLLHRPDLFAYAFLHRRNGALLASTPEGVYVREAGGMRPYRPDEPLLRLKTKTLTESPDSSLWISIEGKGVLHMHEDRKTLYTEEDGLAGSSVLDIYQDPDGLMWFITTEGISLFDGLRWRTLSDTGRTSMPNRFGYRIERDRAGRYYVSTNYGIVRLTKRPAQGAQAADLRHLSFTLEHFGMKDGLPAYEANQGASLRDEKGRIWFGLTGGAAVYDPRLEPATPPDGPMTIVGIQVAGVTDSLVLTKLYDGDRLTLPHDHKTLQLAFTMGTPGLASAAAYQTRLLGLEAGPSAWLPRTERTFTRLPSGSYTFEVSGRTSPGGPVRTATLGIQVAHPPWATGWAYAGYLLLVMLFCGVALYGQKRRLQRRHEEKAHIEQERLSRAAAMSRAAFLQSENERLVERNRSHEFRRRVMEGSSDAIFSLDPEGRLTLFNAPLQAMVKEASLQSGVYFGDLFDEGESLKVKKALSEVVSQGRTIHDLSVNIAPEDASPRYLALALSPLRVEGQLEGVVGVARDVTEKRNLEQFRNDMIRMFVHDLRNPLSNMLMAGHTLTDDENLSPERRQRIAKMIEANSEQAIVLVEGMLDVSRLEAGRMPLELEAVDMADIVEEVLEPMAPTAEQKELSLVQEAPAGLPPAYADASLIKRVVRNLIDNAIKFTPAGGCVAVRVMRGEGQIEVAVSDTGPGVPDELKPYLFQKFAAGAGPESGSGLGLAFCRLAVESLGGRLWLDAETSEGATFRFTLQLSVPQHAA